MKLYKVVFEIEIDAESPLQAAERIQDLIREVDSNWQFYVQAEDEKQIYSVDLEEEDEFAVYPVNEYKPLIN